MKKTVRLNQNTGMLKLIAIVTMLIDHVGAVFYQHLPIMRMIGRLAFPIFCYCIAVGAVYTRSMGKYMLRLLFVGLISQPFYVLAMQHVSAEMAVLNFSNQPLQSALSWYMGSLQYGNIMFALALGLAVIWSLQEKKYAITALIAAAVWFTSPYLRSSYDWHGVVLMVLFYVLIDAPVHSFFCVSIYMAWWVFYGGRTSILAPSMSTQAWSMCALPLIYLPFHGNLKLNKWIFYLFYPGHLALIYLFNCMPR